MKKKILVVEDESDIRSNIEAILRLNDFDVISANNGNLGLKMALEYLPDMIVSDILMPEMDGFSMLAELRRHIEAFNIPFLFLTAKSDPIDFRQGMRLGADDYITKPFDLQDLLDAINMRIQKSELSAKIYNRKVDELRMSISQSLPQEIKTPLNSILGFSDLLYQEYENITPEEAKDIIHNIYDSANRLRKVFEKYLYYAGVEILASNSSIHHKIRKFSIQKTKSLIQNTSDRIAKIYHRNGNLQFKLEESKVFISENYFVKILEEILDNAFKFSDEGVLVSVISKISDDNLQIMITNFGHGLTQEQIKNIGAYIQFERRVFEQQGLGLGIAIAKLLTEIHGGIFTIESKIDYFTTVTIELPCKELMT